MNLKQFFFVFVLFNLCGCNYQKPQMIIVDSNVSAFLYQGEKRLGETPFAGEVPRSEIDHLYLKRSGYKTVKLPAEKVYSRSVDSMTNVFSETSSDNGTDGILAGITSLPFLPLSLVSDMTRLASGVWIEYIPNSFYIEMVPASTKEASADFLRTLQIKNFALKMYPSLAAGDSETLGAFAQISTHTQDQVKTLLLRHNDPVSFAEAAARF